MVEIREFEARDAEAVSELLTSLRPAWLSTPESLVYRNLTIAERSRRKAWVAAGGAVGFAFAEFDIWGAAPGTTRTWAGVAPENRRRGLGTRLHELAVEHAAAKGAVRLTTEVDGDEAGIAFASALGYEPTEHEIISSLDPAQVDTSELAPSGVRVVPLAELRDRPRDLYAFWTRCLVVAPVSFDDYRLHVLEVPDLTYDGSFALLDDDGNVVSIALLTLDRPRQRAENDWTGTLPEQRGRGLARLAKLATIRWARDHGIREIVTGNMSDNVAMLAVNRRLGYRELLVRTDLARPL
jgi:GNAT superfamily N-acetyltransferase